MKRLLAVLAIVTMVACGTAPAKPTVGIRDGGPSAPKCAELEAQAASSPNVVVSGAWNCLTPEMQHAFQDQDHLSGDQGLATYAAAPPAFSHYFSCGNVNQDGWWYFDLRTNVSPQPVDPNMHYAMRMQVDASGRVGSVQYAPGYVDSNTC